MNAAGQDDGLSVRYVHDDNQRREDFDRQLAGYLRRHGERWDITSIVEPLELLGRKVSQVDVDVRRELDGELSVTLTFQLPPGRL